MRVSICVPIYGVEKYITRCVESLFNQTYENIEYIFVNDCTKDRSITILEKILAAYPNRIKDVRIIHHDHNRGLAASRNTAVSSCTSEFIMHVDSDDYLDLNTVELAMKELISSNADIVRFGMYNEYVGKTIISLPKEFKNNKEYCLALLSRNVSVCVWGGVYRRELYTKNNIKNYEGVNLSEDYQITPQLAYYASKISYLQKPLYHYDLSNLSSYTHHITANSINQSQKTLDILRNIFKNRDKEYVNALDSGEYGILINRLKSTSQIDELKEFFYQARERLKEIPFSHRKKLNILYQIIGIFPNYSFVRLYIKIIRFLRPNPLMKK